MSTWSTNSTAINVYVNRLIRPEILSNQVSKRLLFYALAGKYPNDLNALYKPYEDPKRGPMNAKYGVSMGGDLKLAKRQETLGSNSVYLKFQKATPDAGTTVTTSSPGNPTITKYGRDFMGMISVNWTEKKWGLQNYNEDINNAKGKMKQGSLIEDTVAVGFNNSFDETWKDLTSTSALASAAQTTTGDWSGLIPLLHWVSDGVDHSATNSGPNESAYATVGGVDRTLTTDGEDSLKATVLWGDDLVANKYMASTRPTLSLIRQIRNNPALGGINNYAGTGGDIVICAPDIWEVFADEVDNQTVRLFQGKYRHPRLTFDYEGDVIQSGEILIGQDTQLASGTMLVLSSGSFLYEVQPGSNYRINKWVDQSETELAGNAITWTNIVLKHRLSCLMPWMNAKVVGLTTS